MEKLLALSAMNKAKKAASKTSFGYGPPSEDEGENGAIYIDRSTGTMYQCQGVYGSYRSWSVTGKLMPEVFDFTDMKYPYLEAMSTKDMTEEGDEDYTRFMSIIYKQMQVNDLLTVKFRGPGGQVEATLFRQWMNGTDFFSGMYTNKSPGNVYFVTMLPDNNKIKMFIKTI